MSERNGTFALLSLGAPLFIAALYLSAPVDQGPLPLLGSTALFGLPYLLRELRRQTNWLLVAYFLLFVPIVHYAATLAAIEVFRATGFVAAPFGVRLGSLPLSGLAGGFVGAGLSFLPLASARLRAPGSRPTLLMPLGLVLLSLLGAAGVVLAFADGWVLGFLWLYPPWQIAFSFFLSRLLRPSPARSLPGAELAAIAHP
jgi:hypothetical protein